MEKSEERGVLSMRKQEEKEMDKRRKSNEDERSQNSPLRTKAYEEYCIQ